MHHFDKVPLDRVRALFLGCLILDAVQRLSDQLVKPSIPSRGTNSNWAFINKAEVKQWALSLRDEKQPERLNDATGVAQDFETWHTTPIQRCIARGSSVPNIIHIVGGNFKGNI